MDDEAREIAGKLTEAQRERLLAWPSGTSSLFRGEPDATALELCELGVGAIMPWNHGVQMGLTSKLGLKVYKHLKGSA